MIEPLAVAWQAIDSSGFDAKTHRALVIGTGPIGIATIACLIAIGTDPSHIMVVGRNANRNEMAHKYGIKNIKRIGLIRFTDQKPADYWANFGYDWFAGL